MVKFTIDVASIIDNPRLTISSSPFTTKSIIKRVQYKGKGNAPPWLVKYAIPKGTCKGEVGKTTYGGKPVPKVAECVAEKFRGDGRKKRAKAKTE